MLIIDTTPFSEILYYSILPGILPIRFEVCLKYRPFCKYVKDLFGKRPSFLHLKTLWEWD